MAIAGGRVSGWKTTAPPALVAESRAMRRVLAIVSQVAPTGSTVLIRGDTGVGKELVARNVHALSRMRDGTFLSVNCGATPAHLLESQLFGHAKGAFVGADCFHAGAFHRARGGTIFLDEIGELPPQLQVKLLRVIEANEVVPLGSAEPIEVDVRIIAATNRDLLREVEAARFRADLFYRLNVIHLEIPPLRERREDIPQLVARMIERHNEHLGTSYQGADNETLKRLVVLPWKGNVRELCHAIEYAMVVGDGRRIRTENLPPGLAETERERGTTGNLADELRRFEKLHIDGVLQQTGNDRRKAATILGINLSTLYRKIQGFKREAASERRFPG